MITVYFDGACGPNNPGGKCGGGCVIKTDKALMAELATPYIPEKKGETSNNLGEYIGLTTALKYLIENNLTEEQIIVYGDSNMVINQMAGRWKIRTKQPKIYTEIGIETIKLKQHFKNISFNWIPREENEWADALSKRAIE